MPKNDLDGYKDAYNSCFIFHDENIELLSWYVSKIVDSFKESNYHSLLSLGIGHKVVPSTILNLLGGVINNYTLVEGSKEIIEGFLKSLIDASNISVVHDFFESYSSDQQYDAIEMGFVLEHVDDPVFILKRYSGMLAETGTIYVAVPNATSLHRQVGNKAGMLDDIYSLSEFDHQFGHKRYFDIHSLESTVREAGLVVAKTRGIFLKPFSTSQLLSLNLAPEVIRALFIIGDTIPTLCNAIYCEITTK